MSLRKFSHMTFVLGTSVVLAACVPPADQSAESRTNPSALSGAPENGGTRADRQQAADRAYELESKKVDNENQRLTMQQKANEAKDLLSAQTAEDNAKVSLDRQAKDLEGRKYDADADVRSADLRASAQRYQADKQYSTYNKVIESAGPVMQAMAAINSAAAQSKRADAADKREDRRAAAEERSAKNDEKRVENEARAQDLQIALQMSEQQRKAEIETFKADVDRYKTEVDAKVKTLENQRDYLTKNPGDNEEQSKAELGRINAALEGANKTSGELNRQLAIISSQPMNAIGYTNASQAHRKAGNVFEDFTESSPAVNLLNNSNLGQGASASNTTASTGGSPAAGAIATPPAVDASDDLLCFSTKTGSTLGSGCDKTIYEQMVDLISQPSAILASNGSLQTNNLTEAKNRAIDAVNQFYTTQRDKFESLLTEQKSLSLADPNVQVKFANTMARYDAAVKQRADQIRAVIEQATKIDDIEKLLKEAKTPVLDPQAIAGTSGPTATTGMQFQPGDIYLNPQVMMASADQGDNSAQSFGLNNQSPAFDLGGQGTCDLLGARKC